MAPRAGEPIVEAMRTIVAKAVGALALAALIAWWLRLLAHAKVPPPEGRWLELPVTPDAS